MRERGRAARCAFVLAICAEGRGRGASTPARFAFGTARCAEAPTAVKCHKDHSEMRYNTYDAGNCAATHQVVTLVIMAASPGIAAAFLRTQLLVIYERNRCDMAVHMCYNLQIKTPMHMLSGMCIFRI